MSPWFNSVGFSWRSAIKTWPKLRARNIFDPFPFPITFARQLLFPAIGCQMLALSFNRRIGCKTFISFCPFVLQLLSSTCFKHDRNGERKSFNANQRTFTWIIAFTIAHHGFFAEFWYHLILKYNYINRKKHLQDIILGGVSLLIVS